MTISDFSLSSTPGALKRACERFRPARPKRGDREDARITIRASPGIVVIHLRTASVQFEAVASRAFQVSMPLSLFDRLCEDHLKGRKALMWSFGDGWVKDGGVTMSGLSVEVNSNQPVPKSDPPPSKPEEVALDQVLRKSPVHADVALEDAPLGRIYAHFRAAPVGTTPGTPALINKCALAIGQVEKAARALEKLGISRAELDGFIMQRFGA